LGLPRPHFLADTKGDEAWSFFQPVADRLFSIAMEHIDVVPPKAGSGDE